MRPTNEPVITRQEVTAKLIGPDDVYELMFEGLELYFLEFFAAALNELEMFAALNYMPVNRVQVEALFGSKTRKSVALFMGMGLWDTFRLPFGLSARLRWFLLDRGCRAAGPLPPVPTLRAPVR